MSTILRAIPLYNVEIANVGIIWNPFEIALHQSEHPDSKKLYTLFKDLMTSQANLEAHEVRAENLPKNSHLYLFSESEIQKQRLKSKELESKANELKSHFLTAVFISVHFKHSFDTTVTRLIKSPLFNQIEALIQSVNQFINESKVFSVYSENKLHANCSIEASQRSLLEVNKYDYYPEYGNARRFKCKVCKATFTPDQLHNAERVDVELLFSFHSQSIHKEASKPLDLQKIKASYAKMKKFWLK